LSEARENPKASVEGLAGNAAADAAKRATTKSSTMKPRWRRAVEPAARVMLILIVLLFVSVRLFVSRLAVQVEIPDRILC